MAFNFDNDIFAPFLTSFVLLRKHENIREEVKGNFCGANPPHTIQLSEVLNPPRCGDILITQDGETYSIIDVQKIIDGEFYCKYRVDNDNFSTQNNYHIQNISGNSIIGSQQNASITVTATSFADVKRIIDRTALTMAENTALSQAVKDLQEALDNGKPSKGILSCVSDLLEKHGDIAGAIAGAVMTHFLG